MAWRSLAGVVLGLALWVFLFFAIGIGIGQLSPEYREAARLMFQEDDMSGFHTPQLLSNFLLFVITGLAAGWVATVVGKNPAPGLVLSVLFLVLMTINHYILEWDRFPAWYNLVVPLVIALPILAGSRIRQMRSSLATR